MDKVTIVLIEDESVGRYDADMLQTSDGLTLTGQFARVEAALAEISLLSPQAILLDVAAADDVVSAIRALSTRSPASAIFCISGAWEKERERDALGAGAHSVLVRPFNERDILQALRSEEEAAPAVNGEVIAFFSPKGKSGQTTLAANLARALAQRTGEAVGVVDADIQFGDMAVFFNLEPETTVVEATRDVRHLSPVTLGTYFSKTAGKGVSVLCGTRRPELAEQVAAPDLAATVALARSLYRYVLVDLPQGFNPVSVALAEMAERVYLVTMLSGAYELAHLRRSLEVFHSLADFKRRLAVVITRAPDCNEAVRRELEEQIGYPVAGMLPNAYLLTSEAANNGRLAYDLQSGSLFARCIEQLAARHVREEQRVGSA